MNNNDDKNRIRNKPFECQRQNTDTDAEKKQRSPHTPYLSISFAYTIHWIVCQ
jgi:hypothetical protein